MHMASKALRSSGSFQQTEARIFAGELYGIFERGRNVLVGLVFAALHVFVIAQKIALQRTSAFQFSEQIGGGLHRIGQRILRMTGRIFVQRLTAGIEVRFVEIVQRRLQRFVRGRGSTPNAKRHRQTPRCLRKKKQK